MYRLLCIIIVSEHLIISFDHHDFITLDLGWEGGLLEIDLWAVATLFSALHFFGLARNLGLLRLLKFI